MTRVRVGAIGAGKWAKKNHFPVLARRDDVELVGVCDAGREQVEDARRRWPFGVATTSVEQLLGLPLDAVIVSTPNGLHHRHARAALDRGLHVLVEKPMALRPADAWDLVARARAGDLHLSVTYGWHYTPYLRAAFDLLRDGAAGSVEFALCHMASPTRHVFGAAPPPPFGTEAELRSYLGTWQDRERGGGYAWGQLNHAVALLLWLTGLRASSVTALTSGLPVDLYDAATVSFAGGALAAVSGAATLPEGARYQVDLRIFGSQGVLLLDVERERAELRRHDGLVRSLPVGSGEYSGEAATERFVDLVAGRSKENDAPGEVGARAVELLDALHRSAAAGGLPMAVEG